MSPIFDLVDVNAFKGLRKNVQKNWRLACSSATIPDTFVANDAKEASPRLFTLARQLTEIAGFEEPT